MSNTSLISKALDDPYLLTDTEQKKIADLLKSYPYFVPARLSDAALTFRQNSSPSTLYTTKKLYTPNWLLFNEYLKLTKTETQIEEQPVAEKPNELLIEKEEIIQEEQTTPEAPNDVKTEEEIIKPVYTEDYFLHQGVKVADEIPEDMDNTKKPQFEEDPKTLMVMMSFSEWLMYFKKKKQQEQEEEADKKALKTMWQKEKLAAALEEEGDEIPEDVFKMAVDSIAKEDNLVSESLAQIHYKQGRYDKAIDMYRKLSLRNPGKKVYFARKIEEILKNKQ